MERMKEIALILPEINYFLWKKQNIRCLTPEEDINYYCTDFCLVADLVEDSSQCSLSSAHEDNIFLD